MTPVDVVQIDIGPARPPMSHDKLMKRTASVLALVRALLRSIGKEAVIEAHHLESEKRRFVEVRLHSVAAPAQTQLFDRPAGAAHDDPEPRSLAKQLFDAGNLALQRSAKAQRAELSNGAFNEPVDACSLADMRVVAALHELPGRVAHFVDPSGTFALGHPGLVRSTVYHSAVKVTCFVAMAGVSRCELSIADVSGAPADLHFQTSVRLVISDDAGEDDIDFLFRVARSGERVALMAYPSYSMIKRNVSLLYWSPKGRSDEI